MTSGAKIGKNVGSYSASSLHGTRNNTRTVTDVDGETAMKPLKSSSVARQVINGPSPSQPHTPGLPLRTTTKLLQSALESKTVEEVQLKNGDAQPVHLPTLISEQGVLDDPSISDLPPGYSVCPKFVNGVPHDCILNYHIPPRLRNEALEQLSKANSSLL